MPLLIAFIAGDLKNVSVLPSLPILAFFLCGSSVGPKSKGIVFLPIMVLFGLVELLFLVFFGLLGGFDSLFSLAIFTLVLALILESRAVFWLGLFRLIARLVTHF